MREPVGMCRNITPLRGLEPAATDEEVRAAARQYVRKVAAITSKAGEDDPAFERAVDAIAAATRSVLVDLPPRRRPPAIEPPMRRRAAQALTS